MQSTQHRSSVLARLGVARYALHIPVSFYDHTVARDPYVHETGIPGPRRHTLTATQSDTLIRPSLVAVAQTYGRHCVTSSCEDLFTVEKVLSFIGASVQVPEGLSLWHVVPY